MTSRPRIRLGTRSSALARWQADWVANRLSALDVEVELIPITTTGDVKSEPIGQIGGQGLFTKQIQQALLVHTIDLAVHSLKDLPTEPIDGLTLAAVPERESVRDALICRVARSLESLPTGARIGTGSMRRRAQLLHARPDLVMSDIRGNVDTRLRKLVDGQFDAIVLAEAGLNRLGLHGRITQILTQNVLLPAVGQGALGLETRDDDTTTIEVVAQLDDPESHHAVLAERSLLATLRGGCLAPVGAWARVENDTLNLDGVVLSADGQSRISATATDAPEQAIQIGQNVAQRLLDDGAAKLIASARESGEN